MQEERLADLFLALREPSHPLSVNDVTRALENVKCHRVDRLRDHLASYISKHLPRGFRKRKQLEDYRINPYVLLASAYLMRLADSKLFAEALFKTKLYMGLETSFGKSIEAAILDQYPMDADQSSRWAEPHEKREEQRELRGLSREDKARARTNSAWREIDKTCVKAGRRYLLSIKSGPNCINDSQVAAMESAIATHYEKWWKQTKERWPEIEGLDVVIGLTYGTNRETNNKENQIIAKLLGRGFSEEGGGGRGILVDRSGKVRVYRCIGRNFWAFVGDPADPSRASHVFLEVLLALVFALQKVVVEGKIAAEWEEGVGFLARDIEEVKLDAASLPEWLRERLDDAAKLYLWTAMRAFFDRGGTAEEEQMGYDP